jgi:2-C-methyl-D-erythritol 2,4-cyclodiphosphate synthase
MDSVPFRVGLGHDTHRLAVGRPLVIGGVSIDHDRGPVGHSDGDVLLHAVTDAVLGALGLGDIGQWFPDDDPQWKDADSSRFLSDAVREMHSRGWSVGNLDCTVFAEKPKIAPHKSRICERLAELLEVSPEQINVKAKTGEQVGPIGQEDAIAADAIVLLTKNY